MSEKKDNGRKLIDRYLYDVTRRLPEKQREDIEEELRTLIEDMLEERQDNGQCEEKNIAEVLTELGVPALLAEKYRGDEAHLIGGEYYPLYCQILKVVLICVGVGVLVSAIVSFFVSAVEMDANGMMQLVQDGFIDLAVIPSALIQAFGWVTLVFFLLEREQVKLRNVKTPWTTDKLPQIPYKKAVIDKGDSIVGIIFSVIFMVVFICVPELLGAWVKDLNGEMVAVPIFNMSIWNKVMPLLMASFVLGTIDDLTKLVVGQYNRTVMWVNIGCNLLSIGLIIAMFQFHTLFNPNFAADISAITGETFTAEFDIMVYWETELSNGRHVSDIFMGFIILMILIDTGITVYRTLRYGLETGK